MMKKRTSVQKPALLLLCLPILNSCGWLTGDDGPFRDRQTDYLSAPLQDPIAVPPGLDDYTLSSLYVVPPPPPGEPEYFLDVPPPKPLENSVREGVAIQRFGDRSWIVVGAAPAQVWPRLRDFWSTASIPVERTDAIEGVVETAWIENSDDSEGQSQFRITVEPGLHAGNSEIYVLHRSSEMPGLPSGDWPEESDDSELEQEMLNAISGYLADRSDLYRASSVSLLAGSIEAESKAQLREADDELTLRLRIDFERAWAQVGQSLESAGLNVLSEERDDGRYEVEYSGAELDEEDEPGFFSRLFSFGEDEEAPAYRFAVQLTETDSAVVVRVEALESEVQPELKRRLLRSINENLI